MTAAYAPRATPLLHVPCKYQHTSQAWRSCANSCPSAASQTRSRRGKHAPCEHVCVCVRARACVRACVRVRACQRPRHVGVKGRGTWCATLLRMMTGNGASAHVATTNIGHLGRYKHRGSNRESRLARQVGSRLQHARLTSSRRCSCRCRRRMPGWRTAPTGMPGTRSRQRLQSHTSGQLKSTRPPRKSLRAPRSQLLQLAFSHACSHGATDAVMHGCSAGLTHAREAHGALLLLPT